MKRFAQLFRELDESNRTLDKIEALEGYFSEAPPADAAWVLWFFCGNRLRLGIPSRRLRAWAAELSGHPDWLVDTCYERVGDLAETAALLLPLREQGEQGTGNNKNKKACRKGQVTTKTRKTRKGTGNDRDRDRDRDQGLAAEEEEGTGEKPAEAAVGTAVGTGKDPGPEAAVGKGKDPGLATVIGEVLLPLKHWDDRFQLQLLRDYWLSLNRDEAMVLNKMLTGGFRIGVSRSLVVRALAAHLGLDPAVLTHRLMGEWEPTATFYLSLADEEANREARTTRPYPFFLASPLEGPPEDLGPPEDWHAEWKWDGIRAQLICRAGQVHLWSRGDERVTASFPEVIEAAKSLPEGTVLDGELLCWREDRPLGFHVLQTRLNRRKLDDAILEQAPVVFMGYDCLEAGGADLREEPLSQRHAQLKALLPGSSTLRLSPGVAFTRWEDLPPQWGQARDRGVEGLMLKRRQSPYRVGRVRGDWWKWKVDPFTADLVMVYAQAGHGRRATLYTDYTLAARDGDRFVPVAKAYSGLTDEELRRVDRWIKAHTLARRGPVRTVPPELVFEIGFEGLRPSSRHKSGLAMRFPRILRWREDKPLTEIDTLEDLRRLLPRD